MINKIAIKNPTTEYLYSGSFDENDATQIVGIDVGEELLLNMSIAVSSTKKSIANLSTEDLRSICSLNEIKFTIYPNGNVSFSKLDSSDDELKSCYISIIEGNICKYLVLIAFDETQYGLYKAQLMSVFEIQ